MLGPEVSIFPCKVNVYTKISKGPCTQIAYTSALKYSLYRYFEAMFGCIDLRKQVHGPGPIKPWTNPSQDPTRRPRGLSKSVISRVRIRVTPFRVLITLLITYLPSPLGLQARVPL